MKALKILLLFLMVPVYASEHTDEANYLMQSYLKNNKFVESIPDYPDGKAEGVRKSISTHFSLNAASSVKGTIQIETLSGFMRLTVANTKNLSYFSKKIKVNAQITLSEGQLEIYSPVEMDFWSMAKLFIDHADKKPPEGKNWKLKGYIVKHIDASKPVSAQIELLPMAGDYKMILATKAGASGVHIVLK